MTVGGRIKHAWSAFLNKDPTYDYQSLGMSSSYRPDKVRTFITNERSIISAIYNRLALDVAENTQGDLISADEAERRAIEQVRQLGNELLHDWAKQRVISSANELKEKEKNIVGNGKKK